MTHTEKILNLAINPEIKDVFKKLLQHDINKNLDEKDRIIYPEEPKDGYETHETYTTFKDGALLNLRFREFSRSTKDEYQAYTEIAIFNGIDYEYLTTLKKDLDETKKEFTKLNGDYNIEYQIDDNTTIYQSPIETNGFVTIVREDETDKDGYLIENKINLLKLTRAEEKKYAKEISFIMEREKEIKNIFFISQKIINLFEKITEKIKKEINKNINITIKNDNKQEKEIIKESKNNKEYNFKAWIEYINNDEIVFNKNINPNDIKNINFKREFSNFLLNNYNLIQLQDMLKKLENKNKELDEMIEKKMLISNYFSQYENISNKINILNNIETQEIEKSLIQNNLEQKENSIEIKEKSNKENEMQQDSTINQSVFMETIHKMMKEKESKPRKTEEEKKESKIKMLFKKITEEHPINQMKNGLDKLKAFLQITKPDTNGLFHEAFKHAAINYVLFDGNENDIKRTDEFFNNMFSKTYINNKGMELLYYHSRNKGGCVTNSETQAFFKKNLQTLTSEVTNYQDFLSKYEKAYQTPFFLVETHHKELNSTEINNMIEAKHTQTEQHSFQAPKIYPSEEEYSIEAGTKLYHETSPEPQSVTMEEFNDISMMENDYKKQHIKKVK